jgi:hypothetical protein
MDMMYLMKQVPPRRRTRAHYVLFQEDTPYKPKREEPKKTTYQRRPKHKGKDVDFGD